MIFWFILFILHLPLEFNLSDSFPVFTLGLIITATHTISTTATEKSTGIFLPVDQPANVNSKYFIQSLT